MQLLTQDDRSIYLQIEEIIQNGILDDTFPEETRVPSTNELARFYTINPATAAKALNRLVDTGVLYKKRGIGMFVASGAKARIIAEKQSIFADKYLKPMYREAKSLGISDENLLCMLKETMEQGKEKEDGK